MDQKFELHGSPLNVSKTTADEVIQQFRRERDEARAQARQYEIGQAASNKMSDIFEQLYDEQRTENVQLKAQLAEKEVREKEDYELGGKIKEAHDFFEEEATIWEGERKQYQGEINRLEAQLAAANERAGRAGWELDIRKAEAFFNLQLYEQKAADLADYRVFASGLLKRAEKAERKLEIAVKQLRCIKDSAGLAFRWDIIVRETLAKIDACDTAPVVEAPDDSTVICPKCGTEFAPADACDNTTNKEGDE